MTPAPPLWQLRGRSLGTDRPLVMGIVNVTPDSFSDGGRFSSPALAVAHAESLLAEGADILDVGGESTRPQGAQFVSVEDEMRRVIPVIRALVTAHPDVLISVDTVKASVAEAAIQVGARIINDVSALRLDPAMAAICASSGAGIVLMHSRGGVTDMATYAHADYEGDVVDVVLEELGAQISRALQAGIARECIAVDPGIGFSKRAPASLRMLGCLHRLAELGYPVIVGASRKRFVGELTGETVAERRVYGSVGAAVAAFERGAHILRVHDVGPTRQALDVAAAIRKAGAV
jgi:dihydropteroate synthase